MTYRLLHGRSRTPIATDLVQSLSQVFCPVFVRYISVCRMLYEELRFAVQRIFHALLHVDILLTTVDDADESELEWIHSTSKDIRRVCACVHEVQLCEDADRSTALWVDRACQFERF